MELQAAIGGQGRCLLEIGEQGGEALADPSELLGEVPEARLGAAVLPHPFGDQRLRQHRSEEHTSELPSLMRISYAVFCLKKKKQHIHRSNTVHTLIDNK